VAERAFKESLSVQSGGSLLAMIANRGKVKRLTASSLFGTDCLPFYHSPEAERVIVRCFSEARKLNLLGYSFLNTRCTDAKNPPRSKRWAHRFHLNTGSFQEALRILIAAGPFRLSPSVSSKQWPCSLVTGVEQKVLNPATLPFSP
jgi:hypothetical protein